MQNESNNYAMSYLLNNLPQTNEEWDTLWQEIQAENNLTTDRERFSFLTQMVVGTTGTMAEIGDADPNYGDFQTFVHLVFDEWQVYDNILNLYND
jgi:hypothetical protein